MRANSNAVPAAYIPAETNNIWSRSALAKAIEALGHSAWLQTFNGHHYLVTSARFDVVARVAALRGVILGPNTRLGFSNAILIP